IDKRYSLYRFSARSNGSLLRKMKREQRIKVGNAVVSLEYFHITRNMETNHLHSAEDAVAALSSLAQEHRLALFRLLVQSGPNGMAAGALAEALGIPHRSLRFS